jgi:hypothetical protein
VIVDVFFLWGQKEFGPSLPFLLYVDEADACHLVLVAPEAWELSGSWRIVTV